LATFTIGVPISTTEPVITVDAGLKPGVHRFQLEVVTSDRRVSKPDVADVEVIERRIIDSVVIGTPTRTISGGTITAPVIGGTTTSTGTLTTTTTRTVIRPDGE
jgi:hypothetical protein